MSTVAVSNQQTKLTPEGETPEGGTPEGGTPETWNSGYCYFHETKGSGCMPCCCPNFVCPCMCTVWASAMSQVEGKPDNWTYLNCFLGSCCCICCVEHIAANFLREKYGIKDNCSWPHGVAPVASYYQILDTVLVKEKLHMTMGGVAKDTEGGAAPEVMDR